MSVLTVDNVIQVSNNMQFFYEVLLALEAAILGWYQRKMVKGAIRKGKIIITQYKECSNETTPNIAKYLKEAQKDYDKLLSKEQSNQTLIQIGKWFIAVTSIVIIIVLLSQQFGYNKLPYLQHPCELLECRWIGIILASIVIGQLAYLHFFIYKFSEKVTRKVEERLDHLGAGAAKPSGKFSNA